MTTAGHNPAFRFAVPLRSRSPIPSHEDRVRQGLRPVYRSPNTDPRNGTASQKYTHKRTGPMLRAPTSSPPRARVPRPATITRAGQHTDDIQRAQPDRAPGRSAPGPSWSRGWSQRVVRARKVTIKTTAAPAAKKARGTGRSSRPPIPWATRRIRIKELPRCQRGAAPVSRSPPRRSRWHRQRTRPGQAHRGWSRTRGHNHAREFRPRVGFDLEPDRLTYTNADGVQSLGLGPVLHPDLRQFSRRGRRGRVVVVVGGTVVVGAVVGVVVVAGTVVDRGDVGAVVPAVVVDGVAELLHPASTATKKAVRRIRQHDSQG